MHPDQKMVPHKSQSIAVVVCSFDYIEMWVETIDHAYKRMVAFHFNLSSLPTSILVHKSKVESPIHDELRHFPYNQIE